MSESRRLWALTLIALGLFGFVGVQITWKFCSSSGVREFTESNRIGGGVFHARITEFGVLIHEGIIDVTPTIQRIREGRRLDHINDGAIFWNREGQLPSRSDREYYREFVHWDENIPALGKGRITFPGPQRLVIGKQGEIYYTGNHYASWKRVR